MQGGLQQLWLLGIAATARHPVQRRRGRREGPLRRGKTWEPTSGGDLDVAMSPELSEVAPASHHNARGERCYTGSPVPERHQQI